MKKSLLITVLILSAPLVADAARQSVTQITGTQSSIGALKTQINTRLDATDDNFGELYDGKSDKTAVVRYWPDWPTVGPNNVLAINTIVAFDGKLYKATQQVTKTSGTPDPATLTTHFAEVGAGDNLGSATASDIAALFSGSGDCLKSDGTKGDCGTGGGYTNLTQFLTQTNWRVFYSDGSGDVKELALGASGTVLKSNGASAAPSFQADDVGSGSVPSGTVNGQVLIWQTDAWVASTAPWLTTASLGTGVGTFLATPSGVNLASALTSALPASKGGTGLTALGTNVATALGNTANGASGLAVLDSSGNLTVTGKITGTEFETTRSATTGGYFDLKEGSNNGDHRVRVKVSDSLAADKDIVAENILQTTDTTVFQAYDDDLADLADGSLTGSKVSSASTTAVGVVELATTAETDTGTSTTLAVTPDGLAGSIYGQKEIGWMIKNASTATAVADGTEAIVIPASMNGMNLVDMTCAVHSTNNATSGSTTAILRRVRLGSAMGDATSQYDLTFSTPTVTVTWDGTGTNPNISSSTLAAGDQIIISGFATAANNGIFTVTSVSSNTFTLTNASGVENLNDTGVTLTPIRHRDMTSTGVTISYNELFASDETVDTNNDDVLTGDKIYVDVNAITSPAQTGLSCTAILQAP